MKLTTVLSIILMSVIAPAIAGAEDAQSILDEVMERDLDRKDGIEIYIIELSIMGQTVAQYFERTEVTLPSGRKVDAFTAVSPEEIQRRKSGNSGSVSSAQAEAYAVAGNSRVDDDGMTQMEQIIEFAESAKLVGEESIDGENAFHLRSEGIDRTETTNGQEFTMETMNLWVNASNYVPVKMRIDGTATINGQSRPIYIEQQWLDYRDVPASDMYESYRQVARMGGMLSPEEEKQMAVAQKQMAEFEQQMASMPANQRAMMEKVAGPQMEAMKKMVSTGKFEAETIVNSIRIFQ